MKSSLYTLTVLLGLLSFSLTSCKKAPAVCSLYHTEPDKDPELGGTTGDATVDAYVLKVNNYRVANGKGRMYWSSALATIAAQHAIDMDTHNYFSHTDSFGRLPTDRVSDAGLYFVAIAENLLAIDDSADPATSSTEALNGWKASPEHNGTILDTSELGWIFHGVTKVSASTSCPSPLSSPCDLWVEMFWNPGCVP